MFVLGIDVGTSSIKAGILDTQRGLISIGRQLSPLEKPATGQLVYPPDKLWQCVCLAVQEAIARADITPRAIAGVAVTSMGEAGLPLDALGAALHPVISWQDARARPLVAWWQEHVDARRVYETTGLTLHHIYGANQWLWLTKHRPDIVAKARSWLSVADYIIFNLCGVRATDYSLASRTMLLDIPQKRWCDWLAAAIHLPIESLPTLDYAGTFVGYVTEQVAEKTNIPAGTPVFRGGHDQACVAFALGITEQGQVLNAMGTAEVLFAPVNDFSPSEALRASRFSIGMHVVANRCYTMAGIQASGAALRWFEDHIAPANGRWRTDIEAIPPGSGGLCFVPHLFGSGPPHKDAMVGGEIVGLRFEHNAAHLYRALLEGLSFEFYTLLNILETKLGINVHQMFVSAGGYGNDLWNQIKADVSGRAINVFSGVEMAVLGAAMLAASALDERSVSELRQNLLHLGRPFQSSSEHYKTYLRLYNDVYRLLYERLRDLQYILNDFA